MRIELLDHGYVEFIESWGSDERVIEAARMSTAKGFMGWGPNICQKCDERGEVTIERNAGWLGGGKGAAGQFICKCTACNGTKAVPGDEKLLRFLWGNRHATPFEFGGLVIEVQAPIFVFREWHRHRTQSYNEMSARYTPLPDVNYLPTSERCLMVGGKNRQAGTVVGADDLTHESALEWLEELAAVYVHAQRVYESGLHRGIPKELARCPVPVGRYSRMRASANLRNWLAFLTLRQASNAQWEIREYANAVGEMVAKTFPRTWGLFSEVPA